MDRAQSLKEIDSKIQELEDAQAKGDRSRLTQLRITSLRVLKSNLKHFDALVGYELVKEDIEFLILEDILNEPHCEVKHEKPSIRSWCPTCSHKVVAKLYHRCNGRSGLVCEMVVVNIKDVPHGMKLVCSSCREPVAECWEFQPI